MKHLILMISSVLLTSVSFAQTAETVVCTSTEGKCGVTASSIEELNQGKGLSQCGVAPGEKVVRIVDQSGAVLGFACQWGAAGGSF